MVRWQLRSTVGAPFLQTPSASGLAERPSSISASQFGPTSIGSPQYSTILYHATIFSHNLPLKAKITPLKVRKRGQDQEKRLFLRDASVNGLGDGHYLQPYAGYFPSIARRIRRVRAYGVWELAIS